MKHGPNSHINERLRTGLAQSGRAAGMGISYDRYDDESGNPDYDPHDTRVRMPHDGLTEDKLAALSGDVKVTKGANNVLDPFGGLGTVALEAIKAGRRGYTVELNCDYFRDAVGYLKEYEESQKETNVTMFDLLGIRA